MTGCDLGLDRIRAFVVIAAIGFATMLSSCDSFFPTYASYRYELTVSLDTLDGPKTAAGVLEITTVQAGKVWETTGGCSERIKGEAVYVDLGAGRRPLVVLPGDFTRYLTRLTDHEHTDPDGYYGQFNHCAEETRRLRSIGGIFDVPPSIFDVPPYQKPPLVTFGDVADPNTVMRVDPDHLEATLGAGVTWRAVTIQIAAEPVTTGLEQKLPWLKTMTDSRYLDGDAVLEAAKTSLANKLQRASFIFPLR